MKLNCARVPPTLALSDLKHTLEQRITEPAERANLWSHAATQAADLHDIPTALRYLEALPSSPQRADSISDIMSAWYAHQPQAATQWAQTLSGLEHDHAVEDIIDVTLKVDPAKAVAWFNQVQDERLRDKLLPRIAESWRGSDRYGLNAWFQTLPNLSPVQKSELLGRW
jgi:hypothetical protein